MILAAQLEEKTNSAIAQSDVALIQEIFMTLPNKKKVMTDTEYQQHIKDLFIFISSSQQENYQFYQELLKLPLFETIHQQITRDYSKFNQRIEKKFTQAVEQEYEKTVENLANLLKNPEFLTLFKDKSNSLKWLEALANFSDKDLVQQIIIDLSQGSNAFKLERTGEFTGFLLGEATFAYQQYESSPQLKKQFKTRQAYLMHVMDETTLLLQFNYENPTQRHECNFDNYKVENAQEYYKESNQRVKEKSVIDALSVSPTRKTIIPFISVSSRTLPGSLSTQSEQAGRFLSHLQNEEVKRSIVAKALKIEPSSVSIDELSQWTIEPQIMDIAPIDELGKTKKGQRNSHILLGKASNKNLDNYHHDLSKINYRRELNHFTYLATLFSGVINDNFSQRRQFARSIDLVQSNYWSIGVDTQEIYQVGQYIKSIDSRQEKSFGKNKELGSLTAQEISEHKYKALHLYCIEKLGLLMQGLEQAVEFTEVLPEGSLHKINEILTVYHALCGSHGASCSNPIHKKDFPEYKNNENITTLYSLGNSLIKWIEKYPNGLHSNLELFKEFKSLKMLVGTNITEFKSNMMEFSRVDIKTHSTKKKIK